MIAARQANQAVGFPTTVRKDQSERMTSGRAGKVVPLAYIPLLPGDSASGRVEGSIELAEMDRPLLNAVAVRYQAWFVPKAALPQFSGFDEWLASYQETTISSLGQPDRTPPPYYDTVSGAALNTLAASELYLTLGIHLVPNMETHLDVVDSFASVYNFRLAAHSSRLARRPYGSEDLAEATTLPRAFWPIGRLSHIVPDYETSLVVGALDLDVQAGSIPVRGMHFRTSSDTAETRLYDGANTTGNPKGNVETHELRVQRYLSSGQMRTIFAEMGGESVISSLAAIEKAKQTQAFAKLRASMAGNNHSGFENDDAILANLMQGLDVPDDQFRRPWLLDNQVVGVNFVERFSTEGATLDQSVTQGSNVFGLSVNVPKTNTGGTIIVTCELVPERLDERASDEWLHMVSPRQLPDALRDSQVVEPVDRVLKRQIDAKHTDPDGVYGFEPMNYKWNRTGTQLGGDFYQAVPGNAFQEQRSGIWLAEIVDPLFSEDHFLCPEDFPHDVFRVTNGHAFEIAVRWDVSIAGITQIGDPLAEDNNDYEAVTEE